MYTAVSNKIKVTVRPKYLAEQSEPDEGRYFWAYTIEIANVGDSVVQLTHRHWRITDANGAAKKCRARASSASSRSSSRATPSPTRRAAR